MSTSTIYLGGFLLCSLVGITNAGFTQQCTIAEYEAPTAGICSDLLFDMIAGHCNGSLNVRKRSTMEASVSEYSYHPRNLAGNIKKKKMLERDVNKNVFQSKYNADNFLSPKRSYMDYYLDEDYLPPGLNVGAVCECCVYNCYASELEEYCYNPDDRRRRRRSLSGNEPLQGLVDEFLAKPENSRISLLQLARSPLVQALNRRKLHNLQMEGNAKRDSSEIEDDETDRQTEDETDRQTEGEAKEQHLYLKTYLKQKLRDLLKNDDDKISQNGDSKLEYANETPKAEDEKLSQDMWDIFKHEYEKELSK